MHLLDLFKTRCVFINRNQYLQTELSQKGTHTNESMTLKMFYQFGFFR